MPRLTVPGYRVTGPGGYDLLPGSAAAQVFSEFDGTELLNPGFESIGE